MTKLEEFAKSVVAGATLEELQSAIQGVVEESQAKDSRITSLEGELATTTSTLEQTRNDYSTLQARVIDGMFNGRREPEHVDSHKKDDEDDKPKTFKDLVDPSYDFDI